MTQCLWADVRVWKHDPFAKRLTSSTPLPNEIQPSASVTEASGDAFSPMLQGIWNSTATRKALISGEIVSAGQVLRNYVVQSIDNRQVVLVSPGTGKHTILTLEK